MKKRICIFCYKDLLAQLRLNEGFTCFLERKIIGRLFGEQQRHFSSLCGYEDSLWRTVHEVFSPAHEFTKLVPDLGGCDPEDSFSPVPYEKVSDVAPLVWDSRSIV